MRLAACLLLIFIYLLIHPGESCARKEGRKAYDIIGIGLSEIDIQTFVDDEYIKRQLTVPYGIAKGSLSHTDEASWITLKDSLKEFFLLPSGEIASLLFVYASLGGKTAFNTVLASDEYGQHFLSNIVSLGITLTNKSQVKSKATVANLVFVTPDGVITNVSTNDNDNINTISQRDIKYHQIKDFKIVVAESSLWSDPSQARAVVRAFNIAEKVGTKRVFLLSDVLYAKKYRDDFLSLIKKLDILIANEKSMLELAGTRDFDKMLQAVSKLGILTVITHGAKGAIAVKGSEIHYINASNAEPGKIVDKTGSQAAFAAGFLHAHIRGKSIQESGELGARVASYIIRQVGRNPQTNLSEILYENSHH